MSDYISRQAVKELAHNQVCEKYCGAALKEHRDFYIKLADSIIDLFPSAQPEKRWIPCRERLPAYGEDVLISIGGYCNVGHIVPVNEEEQYNWYFSGWYHLPNDVDAWMPLPEPYKENSDGH